MVRGRRREGAADDPYLSHLLVRSELNVTTLWFCEDEETTADNMAAILAQVCGGKVGFRWVQSTGELEDSLWEIQDGHIVSLDSQMPSVAGGAQRNDAGELIAARLITAGKCVHLVWHSGVTPRPQLTGWGVTTALNLRAVATLVQQKLDATIPNISSDVLQEALTFLANSDLPVRLMVLWVLCEGYVFAAKRRSYQVPDPAEWFAPVRSTFEGGVPQEELNVLLTAREIDPAPVLDIVEAIHKGKELQREQIDDAHAQLKVFF